MLAILHIAFHHIFLDEVDSTNDYATSLLAKSNPSEGTVITTYNQRSGKGQIGRTWFSGEYNNISLSLIVKPHFLAIRDYFYLSMISALAVRDCLAEHLPDRQVFIKWPNDIYIGNKKVAGLLINQNIQGKQIISAIIGIGLNVNQSIFPPIIPNPTSMHNCVDRLFDLKKVEKSLLDRFSYFYSRLKEREFIVIKKAYLSYLYKRGEVSAFLIDDKTVQAEILGIDSDGKLMLNIKGDVKSFPMHSLKMII